MDHQHNHDHATCSLCGGGFGPTDEIFKMSRKGEVAVQVRPIAVGESVVHLDVKFMGDLANRILLQRPTAGWHRSSSCPTSSCSGSTSEMKPFVV